MDMGSELSKTVATFIVQKILIDPVSPSSSCQAIAHILYDMTMNDSHVNYDSTVLLGSQENTLKLLTCWEAFGRPAFDTRAYHTHILNKTSDLASCIERKKKGAGDGALPGTLQVLQHKAIPAQSQKMVLLICR